MITDLELKNEIKEAITENPEMDKFEFTHLFAEKHRLSFKEAFTMVSSYLTKVWLGDFDESEKN